MTFKEFHILNEGVIDFAEKINDFLKDKDVNDYFKYNTDGKSAVFVDSISPEDKKVIEDMIKATGYKPKNKGTFSKTSLGEAFDKLTKQINAKFGSGYKKEEKDHSTESKSGKSNPNPNPNPNQSNGNGNIPGGIGDEVNDFFANKDFTPKITKDYSNKTIESSFLNKEKSQSDLSDYGILYTAIEKFKIEPEQIQRIIYITKSLNSHADKNDDGELSLNEYVDTMIKISNNYIDSAKEPNIIKFVLFLLKLHTKKVQLPSKRSFITKEAVLSNFAANDPEERKSLLYTFFTKDGDAISPNEGNKFGQILSNFKILIESAHLRLDSVLDSKITNLKQIDDFVKNPPKPEEKKPEKEGLASRVRGQYLSKRITDNKKNLDRYDRETEKLKDVKDYGYNKKADENQAGKIASRETYGFDIDKPTADEDSIKNFGERIKHLIQNDLLNITGALRIKGIAGDRSEANRKNNAISRTWEEAIMRSNNKILMEGFWKNRKDDLKYAWHDATKTISPLQKFRGLTDNYAGIKSKRIDDNGEYVSNAEERANKIFKYYMQRSNELIDRYVEKMDNASRKVETGKTYAQRVNKEWGITKAYYDLLRKLFDLKLACRKDCEEGGIAKALKGIAKATERFAGDKEHREKNAISNADAVKKMLEKQLLNVQSENDNQTIAKLYLYSILFNSKSASDAINSINNGNFSGLGLDNVKDYTNVTTSGIRVDLLKSSKVYNKPADLFRSIGINPKEITEDGLTQLQKSLNKEDCIAKVNEFKNFFGNVKSKITPAASISFEELFRKNGFVIKEESQEVINARNLVANELKNGIDLTDIVKKINLAEHSIKTAAFKQAIAGNVLLNGFENGEKVYKLFNAEQFAKVKSEQSKYKQAIEKDQQMQQNNVQQPQQVNQQVNNNQTDDKYDLENAKDYAGAPKSVVTTNAADSTYGNGYQKQTPQSRMKEIIYKKGNYTVKTRQMI